MAEKINVEIKGTTPIIFNRFRDKQIEGKSKKRTGAVVESEIEDKLYLIDEKVCLPSVYLKNSLTEASKQFKIIGKGKSTYTKLVASTVDITPFMIEFKSKNKFEVFRISAVNPMTRGRMMTERPKYNKWSVEFEIILNDESVDSKVINEILEHAGKYVGIGDWRPQTKGMFGKFMITSFKVVK